MGMRKIFFILSLALCACSNDPNVTRSSVDSGAPTVTPINGGNLGPPPSGAPTNSVSTTSGGYATLLAISSSPVASGEKLIGAAAMGSRAIFLFERSPSYGMYFWDVFELSSSGQFQTRCGIPRPASSTGAFLGLTYNGSELVVFNAALPALNIYSLDPDACSTTYMGQIYSSYSYYFGSGVPFTYYGGVYYTAASGVISINPNSGIVSQWNYSKVKLSGETPYPNMPSFTMTSEGDAWFTASNKLWLGDSSGNWAAWMPLPYLTYSDLNYVTNIFSLGPADLRVVTFDQSATNKVLRVYQWEVGHF